MTIDTLADLPPDAESGAAARALADALDDDARLARHRAAALALDEGIPLPLLDGHAVLALLGTAIASGRLRLDDERPALMSLVAARVGAPATAPAATSPPRRASPSAPPSTPDATFGDALDVGAMVAVLTQAAADGTPFCEECAKAAAARAAA